MTMLPDDTFDERRYSSLLSILPYFIFDDDDAVIYLFAPLSLFFDVDAFDAAMTLILRVDDYCLILPARYYDADDA